MIPGWTYGAIYYTAKTGSDVHSCPEARWRSTAKFTIAGGLGCLSGGDRLIIGGGTYAEIINADQIPAGTARARTIIQGAPGETVILRPTTGGDGGDAIYIYRNYVAIDHMIIDAGAGPKVMGIRIGGGASYFRLTNSEVKNAPYECIGINDATSHDNSIRSSKVHDCGFGAPKEPQHGIYLRGSNNIVEDSEVYRTAGFCIHLWNGNDRPNDNNIIRYNYVHDCTDAGILIGSGANNQAYGNTVVNAGFKRNHAGITVGYGFEAVNNQVYDNKIYSSAGCIRVMESSRNTRVYNNTCRRNRSNVVENRGISSVLTRSVNAASGPSGRRGPKK
jgi:parallel beta-helix repeat protein